LLDDLQVEKLLIVQKDEQLQAANQENNFVGAKTMQAFQLIDEDNGILFS